MIDWPTSFTIVSLGSMLTLSAYRYISNSRHFVPKSTYEEGMENLAKKHDELLEKVNRLNGSLDKELARRKPEFEALKEKVEEANKANGEVYKLLHMMIQKLPGS